MLSAVNLPLKRHATWHQNLPMRSLPVLLWAVFVSSGGVTAQIVHGNITCKNGALHFIDSLLGYKYNTARDEIELNPVTQ